MRRVTSVALALAGALTAVLVGSCSDAPVEPTREAGTSAHIPVSLATASTASGAMFTTDKDDYVPGETVRLTGSGWQPGDSLDIHLDLEPQNHPPVDWAIGVEENGGWLDSTYIVQDSDAGVTFYLTATSRATGETATATFTDGQPTVSTITLTPVRPDPSAASFTASFTVTTSSTGGSTTPWKATGWRIYSQQGPAPSPAVYACVDKTPDQTTATTSGTTVINLTTPSTAGDYTVDIQTFSDDNCATKAGNGKTANFTVGTSDLTITKSHTGNFTAGGTGSYTITVTNSGTGVTDAPVTVSDVLPAGFSFNAATGSNWACQNASGTVTCSRGGGSNAIDAGASAPAITLTVNVASNAASSITNTATVAIGQAGQESNTANNSASDNTTIVAATVATKTTVTADNTSPQEYGTSVKFTATVQKQSDNSAVTTGSVTFYEGGTCGSPGTQLQAATTVDGSGQVDFTTTTLSVAAHTILACYGGGSGFDASSGTLAFTVNQAATSTTVTADKTSPQEFGASIKFTATVKRTSDNSLVTAGSVVFYDGGTCGAPGTQLQAATAVNGSGQVDFTTTTLSISVHTILACFGGTTEFGSSSGTLSFTISKIATTTTVTSNKTSPQEFGTSIEFTATVTRSSDQTVVTAGDVTFYDGGTCAIPGTELKSATTVNGSGQVKLTISTLDLGTHTILACYGGNATYKDSYGTFSMEIVAITTSTAVTVTPSTQQYSDKTVLKATVTPSDVGGQALTGTVYFYVGSSATTCGTSVPSGSVGSDAIADADDGVGTYTYTIDKAASTTSYTVTACFYSSSTYFTSSGNTGSLTVTTEDATLAFTNLPGSVPVGSAQTSFTVRVRESYAGGAEPNPNPNNSLVAPGDIGKVTALTASLNGIITNTNITPSCSAGAVSGSGYASYLDFTCSYTPNVVDAFTVTVSIPGTNYYYTGSIDDAFSIYDPNAGFVTGGGTIVFQGDRVSFGLSYTYGGGSKNTMRGGMVVVRHLAGGGVCRIKSNSMNAPSVVGSEASFTGKGNYSCVDANGNTTASAGNLSILGYVLDKATPGAGQDMFGVTAGSSAPMLNMGTDPKASAVVLTGGNIQVPQPGKKTT